MAIWSRNLLVLLFSALLNFLGAQDLTGTAEYESYGRAIKCKRDDGVSQRCMPVFENIAFDKDIFANNTCGLRAPSEYCVQTGTSGAKKICDICNNADDNLRHPAHLMTDMNDDETPTWWQSQTLLEQKYGTHLILDFKKKYNVAFVRIRFHTIRPHSFSIYKKSTYDPNEDWLPYQFYSRTCEETYNLGNRATVTLANQKAALCTDEFSGMIPLSGGNVAYLTLYNRPGKKNIDDYPELQDWITVTALRFNFDRLNTFGDEVFGDPKVLRSYYIAVSDIAVGGRCKCNGHASTCDRDENGNHFCECDHNTAGKDCEKCLPLFNDRPWRRAAGRDANPCKACDCNNLADACVFDEQLWLDSNQKSGGRCINCQKNTAGIHCERCKEYHYRESDRDVCKPCNCNSVGSYSLSCNSQGKCSCKIGVTGDKCDNCKPGYYGFSASGCRRCNCDSKGSMSQNCDASGQCKCKDHVEGKQCNRCKANFFDLDTANPKGCKACFCYGHGISCTALKSTGFNGIGNRVITSSFETDYDDWELQDEFGNDYSKNLEWNDREQYVFISPIPNKELYFVAPRRYLGDRLSSYTKVFSFLYGVFKQHTDSDPESSRKDIILEGGGLTAMYEITDQGNPKPTDRFINFKFRLVEPPGMTTFNFQRLLSDLRAIKIRVTYLAGRRGAIDDVRLESTQFVSLNSPEQVTWQEECTCKQGYGGTQCKKCDVGFTRSDGTKAPYGRCVPCECNNHGDRCDPDTGVCECKDNTAGKNCEKCRTGFYGNPTRGNPDDCRSCPCVISKPGMPKECLLIGDRVKCTNCPDGHIGDKCELCADGYFGDPTGKLGTPTRCRKCGCSGNVDLNDIGNCNTLTGECLKCIKNTKNGPENKCELCADGYYGDALKGTCKSCDCFANGTKVPSDYRSGDPISCDSTGKCDCRNNVIGQQCDTCPAGHWNVASGRGCESCDCDVQGSLGEDCDITSGKCRCKPGVDGRRCDQCAAGHYQFSSAGCKACNCNSDGSKHKNCTSRGVCECRPGVLGIKCDQCPENKFNLAVGCISCPKCFDLIQLAVSDLREKMNAFNITGGRGGPSVKLRDAEFEKAFNKIKNEIADLEKTMTGLQQEDTALFRFLKNLEEEFKEVKEKYDDLERMLDKSDGASESGKQEVKKADTVLEQIKELLAKLKKKLEEDGKKIYDKAESGSDDVGDLSKKMRDIAEEARELADKHVSDANKIKKASETAFNVSTKAYEVASAAKNKSSEMKAMLKMMEINMNEAQAIAKESEKLIKEAGISSNRSLEESNKLLEEVKKPLPNFNHEETNDKAVELQKSAKSIQDQVNDLQRENAPGIRQLEKDDVEARLLMSRGYQLRNDSNSLYKRAKEANEDAKIAQEEGLKVAKDAKEMLSTLEGFENKIALSKVKATEAKQLIPQIKALITMANETAKDADQKSKMSESDSSASLDIITRANNNSKSAKKSAEDILDEARKMLADLEKFINTDIKNTTDIISEIDDDIKKCSDLAKTDETAVKKAKMDSSDAYNSISEAQRQLNKAMMEVELLMNEVNDLGEIDIKKLEEAENALKDANLRIDGEISSQITVLNNRVFDQERQITIYTDDLSELIKQVNHTENLFKAMPQTCFKVKGSFEGNPE